jgi:AcrR family transcriptional regulator
MPRQGAESRSRWTRELMRRGHPHGHLHQHVHGHDHARRSGRPRDAGAEPLILAATLELMREVGFGRLTVDAVAARAGVGKATIYRRWPSKAELVLASARCLVADIEVPDTGSVRSDLRRLARDIVTHMKSSPMGRIMPALAAEARDNPELDALMRDIASDKRRLVRRVLQRGRERGEIRSDVDIEVLIDLFAGPVFYRCVVFGAPPSPAHMVKVVDLVLEGAGAGAGDTSSDIQGAVDTSEV